MQQWDLEGLHVQALYIGTFKCTGRVFLSRVKYGGRVSHHVALGILAIQFVSVVTFSIFQGVKND